MTKKKSFKPDYGTLIEDFLDGLIFSIPEKLEVALNALNRRSEFKKAAIKIWCFINEADFHSRYPGDDYWKEISDKQLRKACNDKETRREARNWLWDQGFIELHSYEKDGYLIPYCYPKKQSYMYHTLGDADCLVRLSGVSDAARMIEPATEKEELCLYTRHCLSLLTPDPEALVASLTPEVLVGSRKLLQILAVARNAGRVSRGSNVSRIYSPFTQCCRSGRKIFLLDGQHMVSFDLRCSQPSLIGVLAGDERLIRSCSLDMFYTDCIAAVFPSEFGKVDSKILRSRIKHHVFAFLYGQIRTKRSYEWGAYLIQEMFRKKYPKSWKFISAVKSRSEDGPAILNKTLQNFEAEIFIDRIYRRLMEHGLPALTIHDNICCKEKDQHLVFDVMRQELDKESTLLHFEPKELKCKPELAA